MNAKLVKAFLLRWRSVAVPYTPRLVNVDRARFRRAFVRKGWNL